MTANTLTPKILNATVLVTGLGMMVDFYDFIIFNMVRVASLTDMGLAGDALTKAGLTIVSWQAAGVLLGAYVWGVLGDRMGRKACVIGSILTYSLATLACGFVDMPQTYAAARFFAGMGIAGELGVGVTMISERMAADRRGYGLLFFLGLGFVGALVAALMAETVHWRHAYLIGGGAGLLVLGLRALLLETALYNAMAATGVRRGGLRVLLSNAVLAKKYIATIVLLIPVVFVVQIFWTLSPEFAKAFGITETVMASRVMAVGYGSVLVGDLIAIACSEFLRSRKKVVAVFLVISTVIMGAYLLTAPATVPLFYAFNGLIGLSFGIWMLGVTMGAEQFGTNVRATSATTIPNFARGTALIIAPAFLALKGTHGLIDATAIIVGVLMVLAAIALWFMQETYGKDL